jgi:hypothetical protein
MGLDVFNLILSIINIIVGGVNSITIYKEWKKKKPIIKIRKEKRPDCNLHKKGENVCGLQVKIKNEGYFPGYLCKIKVFVKRDGNSPFSPPLEEISFPIEIGALKEEKLNIFLKLSDKMIFELQKNLPIKIKIIFEFTHAKVEGDFLIGKRGMFWENKNYSLKSKKYV